ncbi:DUF4148 domain-containing protein [Paraburkholderia saeva]|uniref:DUF4148 domain-containing protein n=1 Tax=Paraburkholderia saeva TaxID=2777537 RepID=A0A9N8RVT7_9BURK|nr:DUF4148 domain-containing protein [Paraburkholderia saeva]CAG4886622.1 hypothetical protein R52603_00223 [Paraburkholderia saeva]CAG4894083.1 hypothetical protein LMG31841_01842 [Paraburkholderia saeva]CAG4907171.1 hypothetical protein R70241_03487 [Paraburkholderia saeva]
MKLFACIAVAASVLVSPVMAFAQSSSSSVTRAEVRADLAAVEKAGYNPTSGDDATYPADIQAAEAKLASERNANQAREAVGGTKPSGESAPGQ